MKLSEIRKMNDNELKAFLMRMQNGNYFCSKCGQYVHPHEKVNIYINRYGVGKYHCGTIQRKLCSLCNDCYTDMLDYLGVQDINWEE